MNHSQGAVICVLSKVQSISLRPLKIYSEKEAAMYKLHHTVKKSKHLCISLTRKIRKIENCFRRKHLSQQKSPWIIPSVGNRKCYEKLLWDYQYTKILSRTKVRVLRKKKKKIMFSGLTPCIKFPLKEFQSLHECLPKAS